MKNTLSLKIIVLSILFILLSISAITIYNIFILNKNYDLQVKRLTKEYIADEKDLIKRRVNYIKENIEFYSSQLESTLKLKIKSKIDAAVDLTNFFYHKNKNEYNNQKMKTSILELLSTIKFSSKTGYIFVIDLNTNKIILNKNPNNMYKSIKNLYDIDGKNILEKQNEIFSKNQSGFFKMMMPKPANNNKKYEKLIYIKKYKELNWLIGTGEYLVDMENIIQEKVLKSISALDSKHNPYVFVMKIDNLFGANQYGKILLHQARPFLVGNILTLPKEMGKVKNYKKNYLKILREKGEGYITYDYEKPDTNTKKSKISFMSFYPKWNWAIGSGFYFDDLENNILVIKQSLDNQKNTYAKTALIVSFVIFLVLSFVYYFLSKNIAQTIKKYSIKLENANNLLQKQRDMFYKLFEKSEDGILVTSLEGNILNCNDSMLRMLSYSFKDEVINKTVFELSPKEQENKINSELLIKRFTSECVNMGSCSFQWKYQRKDNTILWSDITTTRMNIDNKLVIHFIIRDVGEKRRLIEQSNKQHILLAQKSKKMAMGEMIENIAHQWRQPLNNVYLLVQLLRDKSKMKNLDYTEIDEIVDDCKLQITYMTRTIDNFSNFIKPDIKKDTYKLLDIINKTLHIVNAHFEAKKINITCNCLNTSIYTIENSLIQVILNILNNAKDELIKLKSSRNIFIDTYENSKNIIIIIKDNAGGIDENTLERIFEPYFTTKGSNIGTGIGLYMAEEIVQKELNGTIEVKNTSFKYKDDIFKGCEFIIKLNKT